jgi:hypothetical protein
MVLADLNGYRPFHERFTFLSNSCYETSRKKSAVIETATPMTVAITKDCLSGPRHELVGDDATVIIVVYRASSESQRLTYNATIAASQIRIAKAQKLTGKT